MVVSTLNRSDRLEYLSPPNAGGAAADGGGGKPLNAGCDEACCGVVPNGCNAAVGEEERLSHDVINIV